jgi:hypothetical protein
MQMTATNAATIIGTIKTDAARIPATITTSAAAVMSAPNRLFVLSTADILLDSSGQRDEGAGIVSGTRLTGNPGFG